MNQEGDFCKHYTRRLEGQFMKFFLCKGFKKSDFFSVVIGFLIFFYECVEGGGVIKISGVPPLPDDLYWNSCNFFSQYFICTLFSCRCQADELELLWRYRHYLYEHPQLLPWILQGTTQWDYFQLAEISGLLRDWPALEPMQALELLLPQ